MRDPEKDALEMAQRRETLLRTGFRLFAEKTIEAVKLEEIASASHISPATLYRYFRTKPDLVIEIATKKWQEYYVRVEEEYEKRGGNAMNAAEELDFFLDSFIDLYRSHKDILRFNRNFDSYVKHEGCTEEQMHSYNETVSVFADKFHVVYKKAKEDGTLTINISEKKLFVNSLYIMLSVAGKYAEGLIYPPGYEQDMTEELYILKHMILNAYSM